MESIRKSRGRQRLKMKFIEDKKNRTVTFAKRRKGIYKKASELCVLTGIDIAILITTLSDKTFSFAHPNIEFIKHQFLHQTLLPKGTQKPFHEDRIKELVEQLDDVRNNLKDEEQRADILKEMKAARAKKVWEEPIRELTCDECQKVKEHLRRIQYQIFKILDEYYRHCATSNAFEAFTTT